MFDLIANVLAYLYDFSGSYGVAILLLTLLIMVVFTPLIFRSTKSMIAMRDIQPEIKKLQAKHQGDREALNQEMMQLYQKNGVNPVGGCLPLFFQAPVFLVLFRVLNGLTRREVDTGFALGNAMTKQGIAIETDNNQIALDLSDPTAGACSPRRCFNPEYLDPSTQMAQDLRDTNEMKSFGIDLSRSASEVIGDSVGSALPYLLMVVVIGILSWYQHQQIQGRNPGAEINPQMQMVTKIMPWFLPIFSFTMPAALCVYFIGQSVVRVGQQSFITRRFYGENAKDASDTVIDTDATERNDSDDDSSSSDGDDDNDDAGSSDADLSDEVAKNDSDETESATTGNAPAAASGGLMGTLLGGGQASKPAETGARHGSRRPVSSTSSARKRSRPPVEQSSSNAKESSRTTPKASAKSGSGASKGSASKGSAAKGNGAANGTDAGDGGDGLWGRAKRRANGISGAGDDAAPAKGNPRGTKANRGSSNGVQDTPQRQSKRVTPKGQSGPGRRR